MTEPIDQLNEMLIDKIKLYKDLKALLIEEKTVIGRGDISQFQEFLLKKEFIIKKLGNIEEKRNELLIKIAQNMDLSRDEISLSKIIKKANGPIVVKLNKSKEQLIQLINVIGKLNLYNERLVSKSSFSNEKILSFFNSFNKNSSYAPDGKVGNANYKSWILNAEV